MKLASLAIAAALLLPLPAAAASAADWRADIDQIVRSAELVHPNAFTKTGKLAFLRQAQALKDHLPQLSEERRVVEAMRLVAAIGDSHTQLEPDDPAFALWYPVRFYEFSDGYFITGALKRVADLAGGQVLEIGGRPVEDAARDARSLVGADNAFASEEALYPLSDAALMKGLGYAGADGALRLRLRLRNGRVVERALSPMRTDDANFERDDATFEWRFRPEMAGPPIGDFSQWVGVYRGLTYADLRKTDPDRPLRLMNRRAFAAKALPAQDAFYIQSNFVGEDFAELFKAALAEVDKARPRRLIVDLRYNFGGDGSKVPAMIHEFIRREPDRPWKELYLITGRRTLSAGIMAVAAFIDNVPCTIVGEPAAAHLNHYGDATTIKLTRTGLALSMSTVIHQLGDSRDVSPIIPVDAPAVMSFADYASGSDPVVDPILKGEEMRSVRVIALSESGAAARRAFEARKAAFSAFPWWRPPAALDLSHTGHLLIDANRPADAQEVFQLAQTLYPDDPKTWDNFGALQVARKQMAEARASYRCALALDPANVDAFDERSTLSEGPAGESALPADCPVHPR
jgi:hypothetical protein